MSRTRNTADLLLNVSARVGRPAADGLLSDAELLDRIDEEYRSEFTAILVSMRSEYGLRTYTTSIASGTTQYRIPDRAVGMAIRDVLITDASGNEWNAVQVAEEDRYVYANSTYAPGLSPFAFTLEDGVVTLLPTPVSGQSYSLKLRYWGRLPQLIETTGAAAISSAPTTLTLTLVTSPTPPSAVTATGAIVDIVRGDGMHEAIYEDHTVKTWSTPTLTLNEAHVVAEIATSTTQNERVDYVCPRGQTVYPNVPEMLWPALVAVGCRVYCEAIKDQAGLEAAHAMFERHVTNARSVMQPRVDGEQLKPIGRYSPLRGASRGSWWRG